MVQLIAGMELSRGGCLLPSGDDPEPARVARRLEQWGAPALHVTDRDALSGQPLQFLDLLDVIMAVAIPVQVRAASRSLEDMGQILSRGAARVIVEATPDRPRDWGEIAERFGDRVLPGIDLGAVPAGDVPALLKTLGDAGQRRVLCCCGRPPRDVLDGWARVGPAMVLADAVRDESDLKTLAATGIEAVVVGEEFFAPGNTPAGARHAEKGEQG